MPRTLAERHLPAKYGPELLESRELLRGLLFSAALLGADL